MEYPSQNPYFQPPQRPQYYPGVQASSPMPWAYPYGLQPQGSATYLPQNQYDPNEPRAVHYHNHNSYGPAYWGSNGPPNANNSNGGGKGQDGGNKNEKKKSDEENNKKGDQDGGKDKKKPLAPLNCLCSYPSSNDYYEKLQYDVRDLPSCATITSMYNLIPGPIPKELLASSILSQPTSSIILTSPLLAPWLIQIDTGPLTLNDLLLNVHEALDKGVTESEWWAASEETRHKVREAYHTNLASSAFFTDRYGYAASIAPGGAPPVRKSRDTKLGIKRVDWLGRNLVMTGIIKDNDWITKRIPDKKLHASTWVITFATHESTR